MVVPGETEPAEECRTALTLGARRGRLEYDALVRRRFSESTEVVEYDL